MTNKSLKTQRKEVVSSRAVGIDKPLRMKMMKTSRCLKPKPRKREQDQQLQKKITKKTLIMKLSLKSHPS